MKITPKFPTLGVRRTTSRHGVRRGPVSTVAGYPPMRFPPPDGTPSSECDVVEVPCNLEKMKPDGETYSVSS